MATTAGKPIMAPKPGSSAPGNNASIRLEKGNQGIRRSTPDSEALTSSDDELDHRQGPTSTNAPLSKPVRRTSWLNEVPQNLPRRTSITASGSLAPVGINTQSPETEQTSWGANASPGVNSSVSWGHGGSFPWATGIWTADNRKEPPPRLTELSQSPTMPNMPNTNFNEEILSPTTARSMAGDSSIPFNIPLHPTPKTYRSQSYSVGQLDPETVKLMASKVPSNPNASRGRAGNQYPGLQHRPSRPSLLEDLGHDPALLGRVREDEDDEEEAEENNIDSNGSHSYAASQARAIDQLARENALLRQTAHLEGARMRDRTMSSASANSNYSLSGGMHNLHRIRGGVPEEVDLAVEDQDELGNIPPGYGNVRNSGRRRMSEHSVNIEKHTPPFGSVENRPLESLRRAHWQTSLGFGSIGELPQSRRHSFADIPTRHGSISDGQAHMGALNGRASLVDREDGYSNVIDGGLHAAAPDNLSSSLHQSYNVPAAYGRPQPGLTPSHQSQRLYIVTFKCHRADVFYIQEDTGLQVNPGNLVIVEADRGTDLGTIQHANVTWQEARELKEKYAEEHYKCLMMFSRQAQNGATNVVSPSIGHRSAVGGMNPTGAHGAHEPQSTEIKPKLIKRLAQNHEILTLRDKEGNEAKAKRVCQQKVVDHRLNMEILDAEFQMDWKKLTFYYFADSYINFNSLVTDLFKIYKTRIWMSAINPASFVTPSPGLSAPEPAGLNYNQNSVADRRHAHENRAYNVPQMPPGSGNLRDAVERADLGNTHAGMIRNAYMDHYNQAFGSAAARHHEPGFGHIMASNDPFASYPSSTYGLLETSTPEFVGGAPHHHGHQQMHPARGDWVETFQGLSLGS